VGALRIHSLFVLSDGCPPVVYVFSQLAAVDETLMLLVSEESFEGSERGFCTDTAHGRPALLR
jgi:hypothetical protein